MNDATSIEELHEEDVPMALVGIVVTLVGFLIAATSVGMTSSTGMRLVIVLVGIVVCLVGSLGIINPAYQKNAIWKK